MLHCCPTFVPTLVLFCHPAHNDYASRLSAGKGDCGVDMADITHLLTPGLHADNLLTTCLPLASHPDNNMNLAIFAPWYLLSVLSW